MTITDILAHLTQLTGNAADAFTTALYAIDDRGKTLALRSHFSLSDNFDASLKIPVGQGPIGGVALNRKPRLIDNIDKDIPFLKIYKKREDLKSFLAVPVVYEDLEGVLAVDAKASYSFSAKLQKVITQFADQMAFHLFQEKRNQNPAEPNWPGLGDMVAFTRVLAESPNLEHLEQRLALIPQSIFQYHSVAAVWFDDLGLVGRVASHRGFSQDLGELTVIAGRGVVGSCAKRRAPVLVKILNRRKTVLFSEKERSEPLQSLAAVPILLNDQLYGVLLCGSRKKESFSYADIGKLCLIATTAASALFTVETKRNWEYDKNLDLITRLPNHRFLTDHSLAIQEEVFASGKPVYFLTAKLNNLPSLYETFGIHRVDELLKQIVALLAKAVPAPKHVFKYSDSSFLILIMEKKREQLLTIQTKLQLLFDNNPFYVEGKSMRVEAEWGLSTFPSDGRDLFSLVSLSWGKTAPATKINS